MSGISSVLLKKLQKALLRCGPLDNDRELKNYFVINSSLSIWANQLPETTSTTSRVNALISFLVQRRNRQKESALVLFVRILSQEKAQEDCGDELKDIADQLEQELGGGLTQKKTSLKNVGDIFSAYLHGIEKLLALAGKNHPRRSEILTYQQRLEENLAGTRQYGDTETRRAGRAEIVARLNNTASSEFDISFNELCKK